VASLVRGLAASPVCDRIRLTAHNLTDPWSCYEWPDNGPSQVMYPAPLAEVADPLQGADNDSFDLADRLLDRCMASAQQLADDGEISVLFAYGFPEPYQSVHHLNLFIYLSLVSRT
jgi:hypothetical protein